jgi:hypothetical protein
MCCAARRESLDGISTAGFLPGRGRAEAHAPQEHLDSPNGPTDAPHPGHATRNIADDLVLRRHPAGYCATGEGITPAEKNPCSSM